MNSTPDRERRPELDRGLGVVQATALNVANMVGIGPFITIPLFISAMGGPHALIAWVIAAVLVICDGLVWSELGAALPGSGGTYHFLSVIYGRWKWGSLIPFLFIWQFLVSGTLEMASGYIGALKYLEYALPGLPATLEAWHVPGGGSTVAAGCALLVSLVLCRNIRSIGWLAVALCAGTIVTVLTVIVSGLLHFDRALITPAPDAWRIDGPWINGLGAAMLIAIYDYLGYYNICHLGDEVIEPGRTIPRAVMLSIVIVATIYLTMNVAIIGVVPWQQAMASENIAAQFMETLYGRGVAVAFTWLILWTVVACMFAITLGYSRIPYAAARTGGFFRIFATVHEEQRYPVVSLAALGLLTAVFCYFPLPAVIDAAVTVRILVQFIGQIAGLHLLRRTRPDVRLPFRMWLYPLPSLAALAGWTFVLATAKPEILLVAGGVLATGAIAWAAWQSPAYLRESWSDIVAGRRRGPVAALFRVAFRVLATGYGIAIRLRNLGYDRGWCRARHTGLPVISIGNLTTGGTGKTPMTAYVAQWFRDRGVRVCIVSRGYGAAAGEPSDEALVLEALCPDVPHLQNADRLQAAEVARVELASQMVLLDDGFQHRRLARDLDIVLIDALCPWGYGHLFPRGALREPVAGLARAGLVIITRVDQAPAEEVEAIRQRVAQLAPAVGEVEVSFPAVRLVSSCGNTAPLESLRGRRIVAFSGVGHPAAFEATLAGLGAQVLAHTVLGDHHRFTREDVERLATTVQELHADAVVCTQKDLVKVALETLGERPLWAIEIAARITSGQSRLDAALDAVLKQVAPDAE